MRRGKSGPVLALTLLFVLQSSFGAGFAIFEQGAKAMGMAGAFTAQADDPSAMFHNVAGLGFMKERTFMGGGSLIYLGDSDFSGLPPFPGTSSTASQVGQTLVIPHLYWVEPLNDKWTFGLSLNAPFGLSTEWDNPDTYDGRFIATRSELEAVDLGGNIGWQVNENVALGFGIVVRGTSLELKQRSAALNPFSMTVQEVSSNVLKGDTEIGVGFNFGILHKATENVSWGLNYRSSMDVDYGGTAVLTQQLTGDMAFDAIIAGMFPFDTALPIETNLEFPDTAMFGVAYQATDKVVVEGDIVWTGWSSFDMLPLTFTTAPGLSEIINQNYGDAIAFRFGGSYRRSDRATYRFGFYVDESPQPDETVGPILPGADRKGISFGYGYTGEKFQQDYYVLYVPFDERTTTTNQDGFNGTYDTSVVLIGASIGF